MNQQPLLILLFLLNHTCAVWIVEIVHLLVFIRRLIAEERMRSFRIVECNVIMHAVEELGFSFIITAIQFFPFHILQKMIRRQSCRKEFLCVKKIVERSTVSDMS